MVEKTATQKLQQLEKQNPKKQFPLIQCKEHSIKCKYFCTDLRCNHTTKIACSECMFEGIHQDHEYKHFYDIIQKIEKLNTDDYLNQDQLQLEKHIQQSFQKIQEDINKALDQYKRYFLEQIKPLNLSKLNRLTYQKLTGNQVSKEDISLILNIEDEIQEVQIPLFVKKELNHYLEKIKQESQEFIQDSMKQFSLKKDQILDFKNFKGKQFFSIKNAHQNHINDSLIISQNTIMTCASDKQIKVFDMIGKKEIISMQSSSAVTRLLMIDDQVIAASTKSGLISFWNWSMREKIAEFQAHDSDITGMLLIQQNTLVTCSWDCKIKLWSISDGALQQKIEAHSDRINAYQFIRNIQLQLSISCTIYFKFSLIQKYINQIKKLKIKNILFQIRIDRIDDNLIVSAGKDYKIKIWDIQKSQSLIELNGHVEEITKVIYLNEQQIASADRSGKIFVWNYKKKEILHEIELHTDLVSSLLRINSNVFASCSHDGTIGIFDPRDGQILHHLKNGHSAFISNLNITFESQLVSLGMDKRIVVWK